MRFCEECGSEAVSSPSGPSDKPRGAALTPHGDKELESPYRAAEARQVSTPTDPEPAKNERPVEAKLSTEPRPLYVKPVATTPPVRDRDQAGTGGVLAGMQLWQWGLACASAAVFMINFSVVISFTLGWLVHRSTPTAIHPFVYFALTGAACCGIALVLPDPKTTLTVIAGGVLLHSLLILRVLLLGRFRIPFDWLLVLALSAGALWWIWAMIPRERGDAGRLSIALTVLVAAYLIEEIYVFARYPDSIQAKNLAILAIAAGTLLCLRVWLPTMVGDGSAVRVNPGSRRMQGVAVLIILIVIRVILRLALRF